LIFTILPSFVVVVAVMISSWLESNL